MKEAKSKMDVDGSDEDEPVRARATKGKKGGKPGKTFKSAFVSFPLSLSQFRFSPLLTQIMHCA